ncbi:MtN3-like protein [Phytophthora cinnamomi]|uniref:MtN3-like protein n=1 Tax=Phytophthora cinnamomi TaxID=4785 RepID=UPI00355A2AB2|nr:MtN3-like protein [Phytophthora cinnamomi]
MEKLFHVLKYKSTVFINVHMVIAGLSNNCAWVIYGIVASNWYIISPNIFHVTVNTSSLVLYLVFNPKTHPLPDSFHNNTDEAAISVEVTASFSRKKTGAELPSPAFEAMASPLGALPW